MDDRVLSPYTGWTRDHWVRLADGLVGRALRWSSPSGARILLPGRSSSYGPDSDALEGFARVFLAAGFRLAGSEGSDPHGFVERFASGLASGTDPGSPERWPRLDEIDQAKVEAASIALVLSLTREWLWSNLTDEVQQRVVKWLSGAIGAWYPDNNWIWFQIVVETFLKSVGGPYSDADLDARLSRHEDHARAGGWYSDGPDRAFDHYSGWAMQLYPILWLDMPGAESRADERRDRFHERARSYIADAVRLVGADGSPLIQGRSLIYRFAAAAPLWLDGWLDRPALDPGLTRRAASGIARHFVDHGVPNDRGLLDLGWHHEWPAMAQSYSGSASPYWASKGLLGLALPAHHPVWTATEQPLPIESGDVRAAFRAPGWAVSATRSDGIVRIANHGTDHALPGSLLSDSPLYARIGYSTATVPALIGETLTSPEDQSVTIVDAQGRATNRTGFRTLEVAELDGIVVAGSVAETHWVTAAAPTGRDHGSGLSGSSRAGPVLTTWSLLRAEWEIRLAWTEGRGRGDDAGTGQLRMSGWPVAAMGAVTSANGWLLGDRSAARILGLNALPEGGITELDHSGPLGERTSAGWVGSRGDVASGVPYAALVSLTSADATRVTFARAGEADSEDNGAVDIGFGARRRDDGALLVEIRWPDGYRSSLAFDSAGVSSP